MTIYRLCPQCGASGLSTGLCPDCTRLDNRRRNAKRKDSGRTTKAWQALRLATMHRDGHACRSCGITGTRHDLTVHLDPRLNGNHRAASLDDLITLCRSCHGSVDAPRAHSRHAVRAHTTSPRTEWPSIG